MEKIPHLLQHHSKPIGKIWSELLQNLATKNTQQNHFKNVKTQWPKKNKVV